MRLDDKLTKIVNPIIEETRLTIFKEKTYDEVLIQLLWLFAENKLALIEEGENNEPLWVATEQLLAITDQASNDLPSNVIDMWGNAGHKQEEHSDGVDEISTESPPTVATSLRIIIDAMISRGTSEGGDLTRDSVLFGLVGRALAEIMTGDKGDRVWVASAELLQEVENNPAECFGVGDTSSNRPRLDDDLQGFMDAVVEFARLQLPKHATNERFEPVTTIAMLWQMELRGEAEAYRGKWKRLGNSLEAWRTTSTIS
jgi:hypothetical protein